MVSACLSGPRSRVRPRMLGTSRVTIMIVARSVDERSMVIVFCTAWHLRERGR